MITCLITIAQLIGCAIVGVIGWSVWTDDDRTGEQLHYRTCDECGMSSPSVLPAGRVMRCHFCDRELGGE